MPQYLRLPRTREERLHTASDRKLLVVVLDKAVLETVRTTRNTQELLNSNDHRVLLKQQHRAAADIRPDILHQCMLHLLDSPLNRAGRLVLFVRTADNQLIEVASGLTVPRTWHQFEALMLTFLERRTIKGKEPGAGVIMRMITNKLEAHLPAGCHKYGLSVSGKQVDLAEFVRQFEAVDRPVVFFVGAVAKSDPTSKENCPEVEEALCISPSHLSAAACCSRLCNEFENLWNIL